MAADHGKRCCLGQKLGAVFLAVQTLLAGRLVIDHEIRPQIDSTLRKLPM
jgi:hypothetical protein